MYKLVFGRRAYQYYQKSHYPTLTGFSDKLLIFVRKQKGIYFGFYLPSEVNVKMQVAF